MASRVSQPQPKLQFQRAHAAKSRRIHDGETLPFSPLTILQASANHSPRQGDSSDRSLGGSNDEAESSYLVDAEGNEYEPYAMAWRYLGLHIDCTSDDDGRRLDDGGGNCKRVLMWAAYFNPHYRGNSIGQYQFYNVSTLEYDKSFCKTRRCTRLDCHESHTKFELVGVFKETDGLSDWTEQLFKHQGSCLWDEDTYDTMEGSVSTLPTYCEKLYYFVDTYGNSLYLDLKPMKKGEIGIGVYIDDQCTVESGIEFADYLVAYYSNYYYSEEMGYEAAATWNSTLYDWNESMNIYKICQPCKAYSLDGNHNANDSKDRRFLENDGNGEEEQYGYNCYDAAGYTNVNQCYKFETKTDLAAANEYDMEMASDTILRISFKGKTYGHGGYHSAPELFSFEGIVLVTTATIVFGALLAFAIVKLRGNRHLSELRESLFDGKDQSLPSLTWTSVKSGIQAASPTHQDLSRLAIRSRESAAEMWAICFADTEDLEDSMSGYSTMYATSGEESSARDECAAASVDSSITTEASERSNTYMERMKGKLFLKRTKDAKQQTINDKSVILIQVDPLKHGDDPSLVSDSEDIGISTSSDSGRWDRFQKILSSDHLADNDGPIFSKTRKALGRASEGTPKQLSSTTDGAQHDTVPKSHRKKLPKSTVDCSRQSSALNQIIAISTRPNKPSKFSKTRKDDDTENRTHDRDSDSDSDSEIEKRFMALQQKLSRQTDLHAHNDLGISDDTIESMEKRMLHSKMKKKHRKEERLWCGSMKNKVTSTQPDTNTVTNSTLTNTIRRRDSKSATSDTKQIKSPVENSGSEGWMSRLRRTFVSMAKKEEAKEVDTQTNMELGEPSESKDDDSAWEIDNRWETLQRDILECAEGGDTVSNASLASRSAGSIDRTETSENQLV